jgi:hypothetical protein
MLKRCHHATGFRIREQPAVEDVFTRQAHVNFSDATFQQGHTSAGIEQIRVTTLVAQVRIQVKASMTTRGEGLRELLRSLRANVPVRHGKKKEIGLPARG